MKYIFVVLLGLIIASSASALRIQAVSPEEAAQEKGMSITSSDGKSKVTFVAPDGTSQETTIIDYSLSKPETALRKMTQAYMDNNIIIHILVKQAQGKPLTKDESSSIAELATDSKTYDENMKLILPVCVLPSPSGISISSSLGTSIAPCDKLSKAEVDAAPYIEKERNVLAHFSASDSLYRFKLSKEERRKLRLQNIDLAIKWSDKQ